MLDIVIQFVFPVDILLDLNLVLDTFFVFPVKKCLLFIAWVLLCGSRWPGEEFHPRFLVLAFIAVCTLWSNLSAMYTSRDLYVSLYCDAWFAPSVNIFPFRAAFVPLKVSTVDGMIGLPPHLWLRFFVLVDVDDNVPPDVSINTVDAMLLDDLCMLLVPA